MDGNVIVALVVGVAIGAAAAWFAATTGARTTLADERQRILVEGQAAAIELATVRQRLEGADALAKRADEAAASAAMRLQERDDARADASRLAADLARVEATRTERDRALEERAASLVAAQADAAKALQERDAARVDVADLRTRLATIETTGVERDRAQEERAAALVTLQADAMKTIQNLANELLEAKSKSLSEANARDIGALVDPLKERIAEFKAKVEEVYVAEGKERATLGEQVRALTELNQTVSRDAQGLAEALRGSNKVQGDWGELILERILESAGLQEGREFVTQESIRDADGNLLRPDVVLTLPTGRTVVIDSKVSLVSWVQFTEATDDAGRQAAAKALAASVRAHLKGLSAKSYESLHGTNAIDFVILFVPLEGAFAQALAADPALQDDAWKQQVLFAGPTTILFCLRTIAHLWRQAQQTQNALKIAEEAGGLYDKFVGFLADMDVVEKALQRAVEAHAGARRALASERGNVVRRVENLRALGVRARREIGPAWLDGNDESIPGPLPAPSDAAATVTPVD